MKTIQTTYLHPQAKTDADQIKMITTFCDRAFSENAMKGRNRETPLEIKEMDDLARWVFCNEKSCLRIKNLNKML